MKKFIRKNLIKMSKRSFSFYRSNEREVMKRLGFRPTKNSGSGWIEKEDGINEHCICQLKSTDAKSLNIRQEDLHVLEYNANVSHKLPVFAIQFLNTDEIWIMIKPEDIKDVKGIVAGIYQKSEQNVDISIDKAEPAEYNIREDKERLLARNNFYKMKKDIREKMENKMKEERREKEKSWRRSLKRKE